MAEPDLEFTQISGLRPEAIGEPGGRTFRILVDSGSSSASIWLEKEQLFELAMVVQRLMAIMKGPDTADEPPSHREAPGLTRLDFKLGKLAVGGDQNSGLLVIDVHDVESAEEGSPATIRLWVSRERAEDFADEAVRLCAAGRPICHLCGRAIDAEGHFCVRRNGHSQERVEL